MNWDKVEGNSKQFQGKARQKWGKLTDDARDLVKGRRKERQGRAPNRYGKSRDEVSREVDDWMRET